MKEEKFTIKDFIIIIGILILLVVLTVVFAKIFIWIFFAILSVIGSFLSRCSQPTTVDYIILIVSVIGSFFAFIRLLFLLEKCEKKRKKYTRPRTFDECFYGPSLFDDNSSDPDSPTLGEFSCFLLMLIVFAIFVVSLTILAFPLIDWLLRVIISV